MDERVKTQQLYLTGKSIREIANLLKISARRVQKHLFALRNRRDQWS